MRLTARLLAVALATALLAASTPAAERDAAALLTRLEAAWSARDAKAYLALWPQANRDEQAWAEGHLGAEEAQLTLHRPVLTAPDGKTLVVATVFSLTEPRARVEQVQFELEQGAAGWTIGGRRTLAQIDGLIHLSLDPAGYRADGMTLRLPDFELRVHSGTVFTTPPSVGPTLLVFTGDMFVRFTPRPETERQQLRQFAGREELAERTGMALVRVHPADFNHVLTPSVLQQDPRAARSLGTAQRFFREHVTDAYVLDTPLPRSPWWLLPGVGDGLAVFRTRRGTLTFTVSQDDAEGISLFDRRRRRQISVYALPGRERRFQDDDGRSVDVLHHTITARFDPQRHAIDGQATLRVRPLMPSTVMRLRLDDAFRVASVSSAAGEHLFFRVRHQDSLMVSLGGLAATEKDFDLTVRYTGALFPQAVDREMMQTISDPQPPSEEPDQIPIQEVLVYSNRNAWYPYASSDDYATADLRLEAPEGSLALTGGLQTAVRTEGGQSIADYSQDLPAKYLTVAVGQLIATGARDESGVRVEAWAVPRLRSQTPAQLDNVAAILRFYTAFFGPCPYPRLNLALIESRVPGGHSPPGMIVVASRPPLLRGALRDDPAGFPEFPDFFAAHELAHQWWGHGVAGENYHERWISEAFAQYAAALWIRESRGEPAFRQVLSRLAQWALRNADEGPIWLGHRLGHLKGDPQIFRSIVYDKGAYVLHMLRAIVGEEAFRIALTRLQSERRFTKIGTEDLRQALEAASGRSLQPYFEAWIHGTSVPELDMTHRTVRTDGGFRTEVHVRGRYLPGPAPLEITLAHAGGTTVRRVEMAVDGGSWTIETPAPPRKVQVNADRGLLARIHAQR